HLGTIRDIQWNPFVPHWIATSSENFLECLRPLTFDMLGEDASIRIWDLRFGSRPLVILEDHYNSVQRASSILILFLSLDAQFQEDDFIHRIDIMVSYSL